jgi:hypothetical protein
MSAPEVNPLKSSKSLGDKYKSPTPVKWRKIGDSALVGTSGTSAIMMGAPLPEHYKIWIIFALNIVGVGAKVITNFSSED